MNVIPLLFLLCFIKQSQSIGLGRQQKSRAAEKIPDPDSNPNHDPYVEPTAPGQITGHGTWNNVSALEDVQCNLKTSPLQIKTEGLLSGEGEINLKVAFVGGDKKILMIKLKNQPEIQISDCTENPVSLTNTAHLSGAEVIVWTISTSGTSLTVISNGAESLVYDFQSSNGNCSADWGRNTTHITFTPADTASHERRLKPENCTVMPGSWHHHFSPDKILPVTSGTVVGMTCNDGNWNVGDTSITCNTDLYTDFEYKKEPWCLAMKTGGSEVVEGSRTTLTCELSNVPREGEYGIGWMVNGTRATEGVETGEAVDGVKSSTLTVKKSSPELDYWCFIDGMGHSDWRKKVILNIFSIVDDSKDSKVGETTILGCFVRDITAHPNPPTIVWKKGDEVLRSGSEYKIKTEFQSHSASSSLEVLNPSGDSNYTCQVTSGLYPASPPGTRTVSLNTYKMSTECLIRSKEGSLVSCQVEDILNEMKISWFKEDKEISGALRSPFEQGVQRSVLFLKSGTVDAETYTCRVDSIKRPQSVPGNMFVNLGTIQPEPEPASLLTSPVIWCLVAVAVVLCAGVATLGGYVLKVREKMKKMTFRLSTREKLDSISKRPDTILRNRTAPRARDIESLRQTLDRKPASVHMSDITQKSSNSDDVVFD